MPRVLSALLDTPSSPLAPPAGSNAGGTSPARSPSSTLPITPSNHNRGSSSSLYNSAASNRHFRRQPSTATEDFTQVGVLHARKLKLKPEAVMMLEDFCKLATSASDVVMYAQMLKITDMQALVSPANIAFTISKQLDNKIDIHSMRTMLSPSLPFYVKKSGGDTPSGIMKTLILDHRTAWGVTPDVIDDKSKWG
ncbi:hypothetical protein MVEN_01654100 [Mycena venus]|uniref:Uncharacterized protein n=1 Tax=Mycena venus TaxID=2733690 RepID=A0A8H6XR10_9AGAR|nr:hypothetical protein MVEN_01654100 [Mycena venus]